MSRYTHAVEHTGRPFGPAETVPEKAWSRISRHTTRSAAEKRIAAAKTRMCECAGPDAWDNHWRIVPLTAAAAETDRLAKARLEAEDARYTAEGRD